MRSAHRFQSYPLTIAASARCWYAVSAEQVETTSATQWVNLIIVLRTIAYLKLTSLHQVIIHIHSGVITVKIIMNLFKIIRGLKTSQLKGQIYDCSTGLRTTFASRERYNRNRDRKHLTQHIHNQFKTSEATLSYQERRQLLLRNR